jgi:hypothetical protein
VAPVYESIWPKFYGGTERIVHKLVVSFFSFTQRECEMTALDDRDFTTTRTVEV